MSGHCNEESWLWQVTIANKADITGLCPMRPNHTCDSSVTTVPNKYKFSKGQKSTNRHHFQKDEVGRVHWGCTLTTPGLKYPNRSRTCLEPQHKVTRPFSLKHCRVQPSKKKKKKRFAQQCLKSPCPTVRDSREAEGEQKGKQQQKHSPSSLSGEAKPPRWPPPTHHHAWAAAASELGLGIVWFSQAEGLSHRKSTLPAGSLPRSCHFVHKAKSLVFYTEKMDFGSLLISIMSNNNVMPSDIAWLPGSC